jgi:hypothetical protein
MTEAAILAAAVLAVLTAGTRWLQRGVRVRHGWPIWGKVAHAHLKGVVVHGDFAAVTGWAGELAVRFEALADDGPATGTRLLVWHPARPIDDLTLRSEPGSRHAGETEVGDPAFEDVFWIDGNLMTACALLDEETRRRLTNLGRSGRLQIVDGVLRLDVPSYSRRVLSRRLTELIDAARRLTQPRSTADRWAAIATRDPVPAMRQRAVSALARQFREEGGALQAMRLACDDASPEVRLAAAAALGAEGRVTLLDLAERGARCAARAMEPLSNIADIPSAFGMTREVAGSADRFEARIESYPKEAAERHREAAFLRATWQMIAHIQSRAAGASPGQLSMTTVEAGRLSIAESDRGHLSPADERVGSL